jgi:hypothetical protein
LPIVDDRVDLFLLAGQSNMSGKGHPEDLSSQELRLPHPSTVIFWDPLREFDAECPFRQWVSLRPGCGDINGGFGPELSFGHTLTSGHTRRVGIVKVALGGTGLFDCWRPDDVSRRDTLTNRTIITAQNAITQLRQQGCEPVLRGIVWYQGERDCRADNPSPQDHYERLDRLIQRFRHELENPLAAVVLARVNPHDGSPAPYRDAIRRAIVTWAERDANARWINVDDLPHPDRLHLNGSALLTAGSRAAEVMLELIDDRKQTQCGPLTSKCRKQSRML